MHFDLIGDALTEEAPNRIQDANVFYWAKPEPGMRVDFDKEVEQIVLEYGRPGVLIGSDHHGLAFMEVRQLDFSQPMPRFRKRDEERLLRVIHSPDWIMLKLSGGQISKPITGKWVRRGEEGYERLSGMRRLGWHNQ